MKFFKIIASAILCVSTGFGQELSIRLSSGKTKYIPNEPIYFKLILSNNSKKFIGYESPLSIGVGSFTFCEEISSRCIQDSDLMNQPIKSPLVGNLAPGQSYRIFGTLNADNARFLIGADPGKKRIFVKPTLVNDEAMKRISSETCSFEIVPGTQLDDSLVYEMVRIGSLNLHDNASGVGFHTFGSRQENLKPKEISRVLEKYSRSQLYPYLLSYLSDLDPTALNSAEKAKMNSYVNPKSAEGKGGNGENDPMLHLFNLLRCVKQGRNDEALPEYNAKLCKESVLKNLNGSRSSLIFKESGIAQERIEDFDLVRILRPDIFSKDLESFLSSGKFDPKWKEAP